MSKKNKRKFNNSRPAASLINNAGISAAVSNGSSSATSSIATPASSTASDAHVDEYRIIRNDLTKVVIINVIFLAAVLTLYYTNLNSHYLERWFANVFRF